MLTGGLVRVGMYVPPFNQICIDVFSRSQGIVCSQSRLGSSRVSMAIYRRWQMYHS